MPNEQIFYINGPKGRLAAVLHAEDPQKIVVLAHGYTGTKIEHGRLFVQTARALAEAGISALRFDFWGSGDSEGSFYDVSPNTEIADLHCVLNWAKAAGYSSLGVLGLSLGGAVSICTVAGRSDVKALMTWSSVPNLARWLGSKGFKQGDPIVGGPQFLTDYPSTDVPEAYCSLRIPKIQIQGDQDIPGFVEGFQEYFGAALEPKKHVILPGADHVFTRWADREMVLRLTVQWFGEQL